MHVIQPFAELLGVANEAIPELVMPNQSGRVAFLVQGARRNPFDVLDDAGNGEGTSRPNQGVPLRGISTYPKNKKWSFRRESRIAFASRSYSVSPNVAMARRRLTVTKKRFALRPPS